ncbi:septum formation family protein [Actinomyces ruminicola]|uniref:Septum formation n=1 Tax=Actinomyces ruminicola TaxID=332524 RepID=A0A1G9S6N3_9ACTO|nr:septum formation family protein [Actinomyces ruminicola]SDM31178.1 Septum formation [Actinomyces ruminicola]
MRKTLTTLAVPAALLLSLGVAACQGSTASYTATAAGTSSTSAAPSTTPLPEEAVATPSARTVSAMDIKVGDCLIYGDNSVPANPSATADASASGAPAAPSEGAPSGATADTSGGERSGGTVASASLVDCAAPHLYEVYAEGAISADAFPDDELMEQYVSDICYNAFETYVGTSYEDAYSQGRYAVTSLRPTQTTWEQGDRTVSCLLTSVDGSELTGSARGAED